MKLTVEKVRLATLVLAAIIRDDRPMSQKGKYRIARMHSKLFAEFQTINPQREGMIKAYNTHQVIKSFDQSTGTVTEKETDEWTVPDDKLAEFNSAWDKIGDEEIEVDVQPIPLALLDRGDDQNGSITANDLIVLGELVTE